MDIQVPNPINYPSPLVAVPSRVMFPPREGNKQIPCQINWSDAPDGCMLVNLGNNATLEFSQISAIKCDNSLCGATVTFVFPDTGETVAFPAYSPNTIIEVFSQQTQFYVVAAGPITPDVTRFQILNFLPPPVSVSVSTEQQTASASNVSAAAPLVVDLVAPGINGTLQALQVQFGVANAAGNSNAAITVTDGNGKQIAYSAVFVKATEQTNTTIIDLSNINVRFQNGITLTVAGLGIASGEFNANAFYRFP